MSRRPRRTPRASVKAEAAPGQAAASTAPPSGSRTLPLLLALALAALTWLVFAPVRGFDFITWDDPRYVFNNPHVVTGLTWDNVRWAFTTSSPYFHPITWISHMVDAELFGVWAGGHHLMAVALHSISTVLLFVFLYRATGAVWRAGFVAALFAIHPMRVESVAWVAERKDILPALALMIALNAYLSYVRRPSLLRYFGVTVPFVLGMLAKPILITLPFALLLVDIWPLKRVTGNVRALVASGRSLVLEKLPWMALAIGVVILNLTIQVQGLSTLESLPLTQRLSNVVVHYTQYVAMMLWPSWLTPLHPVALTLPPWWVTGGALLLLATVTAVAVRLLPTRPYVATGWFWFLGTLVPVIGFVQAGDQGMADRFGYTTQFFLYAAIAWGLADAASRPAARRWLPVAALAVVAAAAVTTRAYLWQWRDGVTLWRHAVAVDPDSHRANANLADAIAESGDLKEAEELYRKAIRLAPWVTDYRYYYGVALAKHGHQAAAIAEFDAVLKVRPDDAAALDALGLALVRTGRFDQAIASLNEAIRLNPRSVASRANLFLAIAGKGDYTSAFAISDEALRLDPYQPQVHSNRAAVKLSLGQVDEAVSGFAEAARLQPYSAERYVNLGSALVRQGKFAEAQAAFDQALQIDSDYVEAHNAYGILFSEQGRTQEAIASFNRALALKPDLPHVLSNRGRALALNGNIGAAMADFERILKLDPMNVAAQTALDTLRTMKR